MSLNDRVDERRYHEILAQLEFQAGQAQVWRDAVNNWFHRASGIPDAQGRVGHHPGRFEAESMSLEGYEPVNVIPWEGGSGGKAVSCAKTSCSAALQFAGQPGWYNLRVQYFDQNNGAARYGLRVGDQLVDEWTANDRLPTRRIDSSASSRRTVLGIALRPGDRIQIEGVPDGGETAAIDYVEILPVN